MPERENLFQLQKNRTGEQKEILAMLKKALAVWKKAGYVKG